MLCVYKGIDGHEVRLWKSNYAFIFWRENFIASVKRKSYGRYNRGFLASDLS